MSEEYIVDPITSLNSGTILNGVLHGEILEESTLSDFNGMNIQGTKYIFLKTSVWSSSHKSTLDTIVTNHTGTEPPGGDDVSYQTAAVIEDPGSGTNEITMMAPDPVSSSYTITLPASVGSLGQILKTTNNSGNLNWVDETSSGTQITQYDFGADLDAGNRYTKYNGKPDERDSSSSATRSRCSIAYDGTLVKIAYQSSNTDSTTRMDIRKNGSSEVLFYCTNAITSGTQIGSGVETISISVSEDDYIELKQNSGQNPGRSAWVIYQEIS